MKIRTLTVVSALAALALVFSYVETMIPVFVAVPGVKVGLANIVTVFALYRNGFRTAAAVSFLRTVLASLLFGSVVSFVYSAAGAFVSLCAMLLLKKTGLFSVVSVSVTGAVLHNLAQLAVAFFMVKATVIRFYVPVLVLTGVCSGLAVGFVSSAVVRRFEKTGAGADDGDGDGDICKAQ